MKLRLYIVCFLFGFSCIAQVDSESILTLEEYLGYVKKYHPIVKQTKLVIAESEAKLLKSRGGFDPKFSIDYNRKEFKKTNYYSKLHATFKVPTWYGIEIKGKYQNNEGKYLNTEQNTPKDGLYSIGVSVPLAKGLLINKRMATLRKAKLYTEIGKAKQQLLTNEVLYNAITTYFIWVKYYKELNIYKNYITNAKERLQNTNKSFKAGDKAEVDTLEASINYKHRMLDLEKAKIKYIKSTLELSNYLWLHNNTPIELKNTIYPDENTINKVDAVLNKSILTSDLNFIERHPKIQSLRLQQEQLKIDKKLKQNNLLPKIDAQYNFLTSKYYDVNSLETSNYKAGVTVNIPLFLRKERADVRLTKLKLQDNQFEIDVTKFNLENKIKATTQQIKSYENQLNITRTLVDDYKKLVSAEEKKFELGEGSLFLINYREVKLIETELKNIKAIYKLLTLKADLMNLLVAI